MGFVTAEPIELAPLIAAVQAPERGGVAERVAAAFGRVFALEPRPVALGSLNVEKATEADAR